MLRCAFLSTDNLEEFFVYDDLVKPYLEKLGWEVEDVSWHDKNCNYNQYDLVVVRSTWDYQAHANEFLATLERIEKSSARLENHFQLLKWNFSKSYLKDLENKGVPILPTIWLNEFDFQLANDAFSYFDTNEIIIKPLVSANADFTYRLTPNQLAENSQVMREQIAGKELMVQSFESSILEIGEHSLFYFNHAYSHCIKKRPGKGDFRVQEEHGGELFSVEPTQDMLNLSEQTLNALPEKALYARVDILQTSKGLAIIEVELIEPSLYFNMDSQSPERFAHAIHDLHYQK